MKSKAMIGLILWMWMIFTVSGHVFASSHTYNSCLQSQINQISSQMEEEPDNAQLYYERGLLYMGFYRGQGENAKLSFIHLEELELSPKNVNYERTLLYKGIWDNSKLAIADFEKALELDSDYVDAYIALGNTYVEIDIPLKAYMNFNEALRIDPQNAKVYYGLARAYRLNALMKKGSVGSFNAQGDNITLALEHINQAIALVPNFADAYIERSRIYVVAKKYEQAVADIVEAAKIDVRNIEAYVLAANICIELKQYDNAIKMYDNALYIDSQNSELYGMRALAYRQAKDYDNAVKDYTSAIYYRTSADSDAPLDLYFLRGMAYSEMGQFDYALNDFTYIYQCVLKSGDGTYSCFIYDDNGKLIAPVPSIREVIILTKEKRKITQETLSKLRHR